MASFSNSAKTEICAAVHGREARFAFLYGMLLSARRLTHERITLQTECEALAALLSSLLAEFCGDIVFDTEYRTGSRRQALWCYSLQEKQSVQALLNAFSIVPEHRVPNHPQLTQDSIPMLLSGIFVMNGSVTDPTRGYHLEIALPDATLAEQICNDFASYSIRMKMTKRKNEMILYLKDNESICDVLTLFGATASTLDLIGTQVLKSVRGQTNRRTNCDMANIDKTVRACEQQLADIAVIKREMGLENLPANLQEMARLRAEYPDACLRELGELSNPPVSRSGINHRLQKLSEIARKLLAEEEKE
ncbi:MAG: DNA-binding protein WhiA [Oscillospiraceae bacterium]|nr:DNA-binding protein WhiA [Oscillospiraceae bacterium]